MHDLTVAYDRKPVLWDVDLSIPSGVLCAVIGPNGAGKSTLIKAALGLLSVLSGRVWFFGEELNAVRRRLGYVPQRESVDWDFPVSVRDVVMMGRAGVTGVFGRSRPKDVEVVEQSLRQVGLSEFGDRQIGQLSGGQQQRVFLARALAQEADLYFMDEPFAGVDASTERAIVDVLKALRERGKTVVAVHHDLQTVPEYFDHAVLLNTRLIASGPVNEVFTRENLQRTYGPRLTVLEEAGEAMARAREARPS
ncbi:MAG: metal ABC transporter ATP-binding protein [Phycisphaerales bacterium]|nr:metal ABC transporter ATP-binding protein [Phycisphaerales bacterium]